MNTKEEIEARANELINPNVSFNCYEVKILRHKGNKKLQAFRLEFSWEKDGVAYNFARRARNTEVSSVLKEYADEVNKISSK